MVAPAGGVFEGGGDVAGFQQRMVVADLFPARPRGEPVEDILHPDAQTAQTRAPAALIGIDRFRTLPATLTPQLIGTDGSVIAGRASARHVDAVRTPEHERLAPLRRP